MVGVVGWCGWLVGWFGWLVLLVGGGVTDGWMDGFRLISFSPLPTTHNIIVPAKHTHACTIPTYY